MPHPRNYKSLLEKTAIYAKMGSWEVDLIAQEVYWSKVTKIIHEVDEDYRCSYEEALSFYKDEASRALIIKSFEEAINKNKEYDLKLKITTAKGREIWVRAIGIPVFEDGKCTSVYGLFQDIDREERKQERLHKQIQFINHVLKNTSVGIVLSDEHCMIKDINHGFTQLVGYDLKEAKKLNINDLIFHEDAERFKNGVLGLKKGEIETYTTKKRYVHKNGNLVYVHLVLTSIKDQNDKPISYLAQIIDLTEQYESKQKLTSYLDITTDQNQRLLNFAHIVSHNLKSHSNNLSMLLELMDIDYPELKENELMPLLGQSVENLSETIEHLNEVVAMHSSDDKNIEQLNLHHYIEKTIENISALLKSSEAKLEITVDKTITVKAIPAYLESILLNLLTNAVKYKAPERNLSIQIIAEEVDNNVEIQIIDNGLGIDLERYESKLFGMYKTFHEHKDSRGIGLFITKNQIEALGGKIEVESEVNKGSNFKVYLQNAVKPKVKVS